MGSKGFSLIELVIVIAVVGILSAIVTMGFSKRMQKDKVESQVRTMYSDLVDARTQALFQKKTRTVMITSTGFSSYSSTNTAARPVVSKTLKVPVTPASLRIDFDPYGVMTFDGDATIANAAVCIQGSNLGYNDSIGLITTQIQVGKLNGTGCTSANITRN